MCGVITFIFHEIKFYLAFSNNPGTCYLATRMNRQIEESQYVVYFHKHMSRNGHNSRSGAADYASVVDLLHLDEAGQHQLVLHLDQEHHLGLISMG